MVRRGSSAVVIRFDLARVPLREPPRAFPPSTLRELLLRRTRQCYTLAQLDRLAPSAHSLVLPVPTPSRQSNSTRLVALLHPALPSLHPAHSDQHSLHLPTHQQPHRSLERVPTSSSPTPSKLADSPRSHPHAAQDAFSTRHPAPLKLAQDGEGLGSGVRSHHAPLLPRDRGC